MTTDTPTGHKFDAAFAYHAGAAQAQVVLATGCQPWDAATAVLDAAEAIGWNPDATEWRDVILAAVKAVRHA